MCLMKIENSCIRKTVLNRISFNIWSIGIFENIYFIKFHVRLGKMEYCLEIQTIDKAGNQFMEV